MIIGIQTEGVEAWEVMGELARLLDEKFRISECSTIWSTRGNDGLVCAVLCPTPGQPRSVQAELKAMEQSMGPGRSGTLTLLVYGDDFTMTPELTLPHPELRTETQWMVSTSELAPDWVHPVTRKTLIQMSRGTAGQAALEFSAQGAALLRFCRDNDQAASTGQFDFGGTRE